MNFDIRTLSIITAVSSLVFAFASITVAHLVPKERHLRDWALGAGAAALSTLLVGLRGVLPDLISAAVANTVLTLAFIFMYKGSRGMVRLPPVGPVIWLFAVVAFLGLAWFTAVQPHLFARILIVSLVLVPLLLMTGIAFWRYDRSVGPSPLRIANRITVLVYFSGVVLFVVRLVPAFQADSAASYLSSTSALLVAPYFWAILFNVWMAIMITITVSARLQAELAEARDQAQATSVAKSQFLANMSHEIRTPMNAILGMLRLLQGTVLTTRQWDYVSKTEGAARSLLGLLNDILDFSKVEAGKMSLDPQPFRLEDLVRDLSVMLSAGVGTKGVELVMELDPALPPVLVGDVMRLHQVLLNLGGNALKFTAQGRVVVALRLLGLQGQMARVEFVVQDTGIGIAPENRDHIFSGFSQAEASTTRRFGGTGLGLAISQRLVGLMGGNLQLDSVLGQGSTFRFSLELPVAADIPQEVVGTEVASGGKQQRLSGMRLLVVEDNLINQQVAQELLASEGALVSLAANGQLGVDAVAAARPPFDAVLMDIQMPVLDGYGATRLIREQLGLKDLPVIAMTANAMASDREACLAAGMNEHVGKPFDLNHLVTLLLRHVPHVAAPQKGASLVAGASTATTPAADAPGWILPVLDVDAAMARMGGAQTLYVRAARAFAAELPDQLRQVRQQMTLDRVHVGQLLHTLKGSAAMLGANALAEAAARLEQRCNPAQGDAADWDEALAVLQGAASATQAALAHTVETLDATPDAVAPLQSQVRDVQIALRELATLLEASDLHALRKFAEIKPALLGVDPSQLNELDQAIQALQFGTAQRLCQAIARESASQP
ncbi:MAG: response regulator [Burkholderiales bacterium]|nr:response regulator [Burkholderiales bacterium]